MTVTLRNYAFNDAGGPIVGATVTAVGKNSPGTHTYTTTTDANGMWEFVTRPDDVYNVSVDYQGKRRWHMGDTSVQIGAFVNATGTTPIGAGTVTATELATDAVTNVKIANNAVGTAELIDLSVTTPKLADDAVTAAKIAAGAVGVSELAANAVGTTAIQDGSVTAAKLAAGAGGGGSGGIPDDNSVSTIKIQDGAVTSAKLATGAVTTTKFAAGAVDTAALGALAVTGAKIANATITSTQLATDSVTATQIAAGAVGSAEIATGAVGSTQMGANAIGPNNIISSAVTLSKLASNSVDATKIVDGSVGSAELAAAAVGTAALVDGAVTRPKLSADLQFTNVLTSSGTLFALGPTNTTIFSLGTFPAGTYLIFATLQVQFTTVDEKAEFHLLCAGVDIVPVLTAHGFVANALVTITGLWLTTMTGSGTVILQGKEIVGSGVSVVRNASSFGIVQLPASG